MDPDDNVDAAAWGVVNYYFKTDLEGYKMQCPGETNMNKIADTIYDRIVAVLRSPEPLDCSSGSLSVIFGLTPLKDPVDDEVKKSQANVVKKVKTCRRKLGLPY